MRLNNALQPTPSRAGGCGSLSRFAPSARLSLGVELNR
jgi:hypothetical protein